MKRFELIEHTADVGIRGSGSSLSEAFEAAAEGLFSILVNPSGVRVGRCHPIQVAAPTAEALLVEWLSELLAQCELTGDVFASFEAAIEGGPSSGYRIEGKACGEPLDATKHDLGTEVKGISYLGLEVVQTPDRCSVRCVVDV